MSFQLHLPGFEGHPPDLLQLVERNTVALDGLSLASITEQFSQYFGDGRRGDLQGAGEFMAVAARLMLMKSELLLPNVRELVDDADVEDDGRTWSAAERQTILNMAMRLRNSQGNECFPARSIPHPEPRLIEVQSTSLLLRAWEDMKKRPLSAVVEVTAPAFVRLEVALSRLMRRLSAGRSFSFNSVLRGSTRFDAAIHFLALLELVRRRNAEVTQDELFGEIHCESTSRENATISRAG